MCKDLYDVKVGDVLVSHKNFGGGYEFGVVDRVTKETVFIGHARIRRKDGGCNLSDAWNFSYWQKATAEQIQNENERTAKIEIIKKIEEIGLSSVSLGTLSAILKLIEDYHYFKSQNKG